MRDFFIRSLEIVINVFIVLAIIAVVVVAGMAAFGGGAGPGMPSGPLVGLMILIGGFLYLIIIGGFMYLGLGVYQNTKRTAEAIERMGSR